MKPRILLFLFLLLFTALFTSQAAFSQTASTGAIAGTVLDLSGAVVSKASITITNVDTGIQRTLETNAQGIYRIPLLEPGRYDVEVAAASFDKDKKTNLTINVSETQTLNFILRPVGNAVTVNVEASTPLVQTEAVTQGGLVDHNTVESLPLSTRNYTQILNLSPGVQSDVNNAGNIGRNTQDVFVNGARSIDNNFQMDGAAVNNFGTGRGGDWLGYSGIPVPNPDAVQEFNVQTSLYDAGYGRGAGANVNVVTRSGTNAFHGNLFEFLRNDALNANDYFLKQHDQSRPVLRQNQFGATLGGPILKNKLFFFTSYQGTRQTNGVGSASLASADLPAELTDDRSAAALGKAFAGQNGYYGGVAVAADGSNINPVALKLLKYKLPNGQYLIPSPQKIVQSVQQDGTVTSIGSSVYSVPSTFAEDQYLANLDYVVSSRHRLSARLFSSNDPQTASFTTSNLPGSGARSNFRNRSTNFKLTSILTPTFVNEARFSFTRSYGRLNTLTPVTNSEIGLAQSADQAIIPSISVSGLFSIGGQANDIFKTAINNYQWADQASTTIGRHNLRFGVEFERTQDNFDLPGVKRGTLSFLSFADFLLGESAAQNGSQYSNVYSSWTQAGITDRHFRVNNFAAFVQDDYKLSSRLTLNLGLRWDVFGGLSEQDGRLVNFWPSLANNDFSSGGSYTGYVVADNFKGELPDGVQRTGNNTGVANATQWGNIGPRVGLAWRPFSRSDRFVVRAGYGVYYSRTSGNNVLQLLLEPPYVGSAFSSDTGNAAATFQNPWVVKLPSASQYPIWTPRTTDGSSYIQSLDPNWTTPITQQWSLDLQTEVARGLLWEVGYVGTRGQHLALFRLPNQAQLASPSHPINGETTNTVANSYLRVPTLGFAPSGIWQVETQGNSFYNGLQTSLTKRLGHGVQFKAAYTFSKSLDDVPTGTPNLFTGSTGYTSIWGGLLTGDQNSRRTSWGLSDFDRTHRFVFSYLWNLPGLHGGNSILRAVVNNWSLSGVTTIQSGNALSVYDVNSGSIYGLSYNQAQLADGSKVTTSGSTQSRLNNWINASAFSAPVAIGDGYGFGNSGRGIVRGPGQNDTDLSVSRNIPLRVWTENSSLQFRADFFNLLNHAQFSDPGTVLGNANFGQIQSTSVMPRIVQFALKLNF